MGRASRKNGRVGAVDLAAATLPSDIAPRYGPVAIGTRGSTAQNVRSDVGTSRKSFLIARACTDVTLTYVNGYNGAASTYTDTDETTDLVLSAAIEYGGVIYQCRWGGKTVVTINPAGIAECDPLPLDIPAGTVIYVRTYVSAGNWHPAYLSTGATAGGGFTATTDLTAPGSAAITDVSSLTYLMGPREIRGRYIGTTRSLLVLGDSIATGQGDGQMGAYGYNATVDKFGRAGYPGRWAAASGIGVTSISMPGDTAQNYVAIANRRLRHVFASRGATYCLQPYGRNDITQSRTLAQVQADTLTIDTMMSARGIRVIRPTITPRCSSSSDGFATTANQTVDGNESIRVAFNAWLRDGAPIDGSGAAVAVGTVGANRAKVYDTTKAVISAAYGTHPVYAIVEVADLVESARDSGKWKVNVVNRTFNDAVGAANSFTVTSASGAAFTAGDLGRVLILPGAGSGGFPVLSTIIRNVNSGTNIGLVDAINATGVSGVTASIADVYTQDGLHPGWLGHTTIAAGLPPLATL